MKAWHEKLDDVMDYLDKGKFEKAAEVLKAHIAKEHEFPGTIRTLQQSLSSFDVHLRTALMKCKIKDKTAMSFVLQAEKDLHGIRTMIKHLAAKEKSVK